MALLNPSVILGAPLGPRKQVELPAEDQQHLSAAPSGPIRSYPALSGLSWLFLILASLGAGPVTPGSELRPIAGSVARRLASPIRL